MLSSDAAASFDLLSFRHHPMSNGQSMVSARQGRERHPPLCHRVLLQPAEDFLGMTIRREH
jgi:hypothetical protein